MRCYACNYADQDSIDPRAYHNDSSKKFIELRSLERAPFDQEGEIKQFYKGEKILHGKSTKLFACPICGTVRIEAP